MAEKKNTNNSGTSGTASVQVDPQKVAQARLILDGCSKKIETNLKNISKYVEDIALSWDSDVSKRFVTESAKKVTVLREGNSIIDKNVKTFLDNLLAAFNASETFIKTNAEMFK